LLNGQEVFFANSVRLVEYLPPPVLAGGFDCQHSQVFRWKCPIMRVLRRRKDEVWLLAEFGYGLVRKICLFPE